MTSTRNRRQSSILNSKERNGCPLPTRDIVAVLFLSASMLVSPLSHARCEDGQQEVATLFIEESRNNVDDIERLVLLKQSLKACPNFVAWIELGRVQLALDNTADATNAFEEARDYYSPDEEGNLTTTEVRRIAIGSGWLAESHQRNGEVAAASVATQESKSAFRALNQSAPERLIRLQAEIDDVLSNADASVLARSLELQHERASRGIGVRPIIREADESADVILETDQMESDFSGVLVASAGTESELTNSTNDPSGGPTAPIGPTQMPAGTASPTGVSESRLNIPVLFDYNSADLSLAGQHTVAQLGVALNTLRLGPTSAVIIIGHTDSRGSVAYNQTLSERRASTVMHAIQRLVDTKLVIKSVGRGESELRYTGYSDDDHRRNRRVELVVRR